MLMCLEYLGMCVDLYVHTFTSFQTSLRDNPIKCWALIIGFSCSLCHSLVYTMKLFSHCIYIKKIKLKLIRVYHQFIHVAAWDNSGKKMRVVQRKAFNYWWPNFHRMIIICLGMIVFLRTEIHTSSISLCKLWSNQKDDRLQNIVLAEAIQGNTSPKLR